jgi:hypothetical protein
VFSLFPTASVPAFKLAGYVVDSTHIRLVETSDSLNGTLGGIALGQGANTGAFSSISGNSYVAGLAGIDENGAFQAAGVFTANSASAVSGAMNYNDLIGTGPETPSTITGGTYTVDSTGRVTMTGVTDGIETFNLQIYLTGNGAQGEATAITVDENDVLAGLAWQQTGSGSLTASSLFGTYALDASGAAGPMTSGNELDAVGPIMADGVGNLTGTADRNNLSQGTATDLTVSGTFMANPDGAFTGRIMGLDITTSTNNDAFSYYLIDTTKVLAIETDGNQLTLGLFTLEQ